MRLCFIKEPGQPMELLVDGSMIEVTAAIGMMIQHIWYGLPFPQQLLFKAAIQTVVTDESPTWSAPSGITVDASELLRRASEEKP